MPLHLLALYSYIRSKHTIQTSVTLYYNVVSIQYELNSYNPLQHMMCITTCIVNACICHSKILQIVCSCTLKVPPCLCLFAFGLIFSVIDLLCHNCNLVVSDYNISCTFSVMCVSLLATLLCFLCISFNF